MKIYLARAMSGRIMADVVREAANDRMFLSGFVGWDCLDPVEEEGVKPENRKLQASYEDMVGFWRRDKQLIREANVIFDMTPSMKSEGVAHELAYARYCLWKPVVRVYTSGVLPPKGSVAYFEDDVIVGSLLEACAMTDNLWGTRAKRIRWRLSLLRRCLWKFIRYQIGEFK